MLPTARMPASGGLMMAVNWSMSNMPRFDTLKVPPVYSSGLSRRSLARPASSFTSAEISRSDFRSAFRTTGVIRPSSTATATLRCTSFQ